MERTLMVNGFSIEATFKEESIRHLFVPMLRRWSEQASQRKGRYVVFLSAPPGAGKSTLAAFLESMSRETKGILPVQALGMDGFHYHQREIEQRQVLRNGVLLPMKQVKGGPESFDVDKLEAALKALRAGEELRWPLYDRKLHDVVEDAIAVTEGVVLVEGNWLLYGEEPWTKLRGLCDASVALLAEEEQLKDRLVERKRRGGLSLKEALDFYERSDGVNVRLWLANSLPAEETWTLPL